MKLSEGTKIESDRFYYRPLEAKDATPNYLSWLSDEAAVKFIKTAADTKELKELEQYIVSKLESDEALFLGIFEKDSKEHIGNIKYEPLNQESSYAVMGILVGNPTWRGKGVAKEAILSTSLYLKNELNISEIVLGVEKENTPAVKAYEKIGFKVLQNDPRFPSVEDAYFMGLKEF